MKLNINAVMLWAAWAIGFHLLGGNWLLGLWIGLVISIAASFLPNK